MNITGVELQGPEATRVGNLFISERPSGVGVLFMHGYRSNRIGYAEYAEAVTESAGATCLTFDLGGHGESEGDSQQLTIVDHVDDAYEALFHLYDQEGVERIGIVGASYGGYLATILGAMRNDLVKSLVLRAPALYPDGLEREPRKEWDTEAIDDFRSKPESMWSTKNMRLVRRFAGKILVVRSEFDESIPKTVTDAYLESASNGEEIVIKGARHSLEGDQRQVFKKIVMEWAQTL